MTPQVWLAEQPLQAGERLYLVPIWSGTPYDTWQPVMPYLSELMPRSAFLNWVAETDAEDWGWLAVST
ncbi:hypothetical protein A246_27934, partial [Pseudomonas syringae pv. actinidiae ICMP 19098]